MKRRGSNLGVILYLLVLTVVVVVLVILIWASGSTKNRERNDALSGRVNRSDRGSALDTEAGDGESLNLRTASRTRGPLVKRDIQSELDRLGISISADRVGKNAAEGNHSG